MNIWHWHSMQINPTCEFAKIWRPYIYIYVYIYDLHICIYKVLTIETEFELLDENEAFFVLVATSDSLSNISTQDFLFFSCEHSCSCGRLSFIEVLKLTAFHSILKKPIKHIILLHLCFVACIFAFLVILNWGFKISNYISFDFLSLIFCIIVYKEHPSVLKCCDIIIIIVYVCWDHFMHCFWVGFWVYIKGPWTSLCKVPKGLCLLLVYLASVLVP